MLYLKVLHDMVPQISEINSESSYHALEIYVLNIEENYLPNWTAFLDIYLYLKSKNNEDSVKYV